MIKYITISTVRDGNISSHDLAFSCKESRECKSLYEGMYKKKVSVVRYERPTNIR
jgi:hypothetical protein